MKLHITLPAFFVLILPLFCIAQTGTFDWNKDATDLFPCIKHAKIDAAEPRLMKINALRIDLTEKKLSFYATPAAPDAGKPMPDFPEGTIRTRRQRTRAFIEQANKPVKDGGLGLNMIAAVNTNPWRPWQKPWNHKYADSLGLIVSNGKLVCPGNGNPSFLVMKDGSFQMAATPAGYDITNVSQAVTGFKFVLQNGKVIGDTKQCHPRTGFGLSQDNHFLIILVIDGRQKDYSLGATEVDVGNWLLFFGSFTGINMDGGGSTTLAYWDAAQNKTVKLNHQRGGAERSVGCNLGFILK